MQRQNGRSPASDPLRGVAIEEAEAEELIAELSCRPRTAPAARLPACARCLLSTSRPRRGNRANETPLHRAARVFHLGPQELDALVLALAVELDRRFARLVSYLNDHSPAPDRPWASYLRSPARTLARSNSATRLQCIRGCCCSREMGRCRSSRSVWRRKFCHASPHLNSPDSRHRE